MTSWTLAGRDHPKKAPAAAAASATESGPSNLCYNPFGSRGDGTLDDTSQQPEWRKETTVGEEKKEEEE